jgi:DNA-binding NtrC family response regulator
MLPPAHGTSPSEPLVEAALGLARALSLEELVSRLCRAAVDLLGLSEAAVYLPRRGTYVRVACEPSGAAYPSTAPVAEAHLAALGGSPQLVRGAPWHPLQELSLIAVPLPGRRRAAGFMLGEGQLSEDAGALNLLVGLTGVLLEDHEVEVRRSRSMELHRPTEDLASFGLVGDSSAMHRVADMIRRLAAVDSTVLLTGETGTGKTIIAEAIHRAGARAERPFMALNCSAIPEALIESELFGHEAGAFTGAVRTHRGKIEQTAGGTLLLDEVVELPSAAQAKLLSFLESRRFFRVGGEEELQADVRLISATNADPEEALRTGQLREDLYYRLNVFTLELPPLRERSGDVVLLAKVLGDEVARRYGYPELELDAEAHARLLAYPWPGNVRELRNVMEKAVILSEGGRLESEVLPGAERRGGTAGVLSAGGRGDSLETTSSFADAKARLIEAWEARYVSDLLVRCEGNLAAACRKAKMDKRNLQRKIKRYGIDLETIRVKGGRSRG